ncbi:hypothetical protein Q7P37_001919 [Cladosporium fusiforme]
MAEVNLADALERVRTGGVKDRAEGLADLKHILRHNQSSSSLSSLSDASYHRIYEVLFGLAISEQAAYAKAKTTSLQSAASNRLQSCASTLRLAVEVGVASVKLKTIKALLDHFIETLPMASGDICEPLALDYSKSMRAILAYQPHVEHLPKAEWERTTEFCLEYMRPTQSGSFNSTAPTGLVAPSVSSRSSRSRINNSLGSQGVRGPAKLVAEEMVACLRLLTIAPNAPVCSLATKIMQTVIGFLQENSASNPAHQDAFSAISNVLTWTKTEKIDLTRQVTTQLVRLMRSYWAPKTSGLKEILMTSMHLQLYIRDQCHAEGADSMRSELNALYEVLRSEYSKRQERDQMHMDDIRFGVDVAINEGRGSITCGILSLQSTGARAEQGWAVIHLMGFITKMLRTARNEDASDDDADEENHDRPRKRQRVTNEMDDLLKSASSGTVGSRVTALQTLTFVLQQSAFTASQLRRVLESLVLLGADENATVASWALLAVASCAYQASSTDDTLSPSWSTLWQLACRSMANAGTCRAACGVVSIMLRLPLVLQASVSDLQQSLAVTFELSGPNILCDTAIEFVRVTMAQSISINPGSATTIANSVMGWLLRRWLPSKFEERAYAISCCLFESTDVVNLIAQYLGSHRPALKSAGLPVWDTLGRAWLHSHENDRLVLYLLSLPEEPNFQNSNKGLCQTALSSVAPKSSSEALILDHLIRETGKATEVWTQMTHDRPQGISSDVFAALCQFTAASICVAHGLSFLDSRRQSQLQQHCHSLSRITSQYLANQACGQEKVDIFLSGFGRHIWPPRSEDASDVHRKQYDDRCRKALSLVVTEAIASRNTSQYLDGQADEDDIMAMDNSYESQESRRGRTHAGTVELVNDFSVTFSALELRAAIPLYASIVASTVDNKDDAGTISSTVMDNLLALPAPTILASRAVLVDLLTWVPDLATSDTERLLEFLTENVLQVYVYERSEVALGTILDTMIGLKSFWMDASNKNLADLGLDMYDWCVSTALKAGVLSPSVQKKVSTLLLQLCHVNTDYGHNDDVPSVRTSLFELLRHGAISVQFHMADRISTIFGLFVLSAHGAMFDDLQGSLTSNTDWTEGLAMRLLVLAKLASSWRSLLRQSLFYIFETAGRVEDSIPYARACVKEVASSLNFESPQQIFRLFASQLLHTWLADQQLAALPFSAFGFDSLQDLLADVQAEVVAQLLMRGLDDEMHFVATTLGINVKDLLVQAFGKAVAYAISRDITLPPSEQKLSCENRLRNIIGDKQEYRQLSVEHFATIMGFFLLCMNQEDLEDNWLEKRNTYPTAYKALTEMKGFSYSMRPLPAPQQPSFKSKYLPDQIERFCRRTSHDPSAPWEASTFAVAARMLFDKLDTALGSLHNCTVLRKLRILVATAGEVAVTGYPLEMLLRGIRPYLTDSQCADDALGILNYLMLHGEKHLRSNAKFLCGMLTITLLETRAHMGNKHDSTTQETQHRETVQKMQNFHKSSVQYLHQTRDAVEESLRQDYDALVRALSQLQLPGNARKGSPESTLVLLLVRQSGGELDLFEFGDVDAALVILTKDFEAPRSIVEDALGDDVMCVAFAPSLWRVIQTYTFDKNFLLWMGKALGRAYAASGNFNALPKKRASKSLPTSRIHLAGVQQTYTIIVQRLCEIVLSPTRTESGLAEYALRQVASTLPEDSDDEAMFRETLPDSLAPSILRGTYGYVPPAIPKYSVNVSDRHMLSTALASRDKTELTEWVTQIALVLCRWPSAPSLLAALPPVFLSFPYLAVDLLPAMVHMLLELEAEAKQDLKAELSNAIMQHLGNESEQIKPKQVYLLDLILHMRRQPYPKEKTKVDRHRWFDVDYMLAANVAAKLSKPTFALMLAESTTPLVPTNRRASVRASFPQSLSVHVPEDMLLSIFEQVDEPDSFYGVEQTASLETVLGRLDYEKSGYRSLMFRSAQVDSHMRQAGQLGSVDALGMVRSLSDLNLSSLTYALTTGALGSTAAATGEMLDSARKLQQWDIALPESTTDGSSRLLAIHRELDHASTLAGAVSSIQDLTMDHLRDAQQTYAACRPSRSWLACLGLASESLDLVSSCDNNDLLSIWSKLRSRNNWMEKARFEDFDVIQQGRITTFSVLCRNESLLSELHVPRNTMRTSEAQALLSYSALARHHAQLQTALCAATQVNDLALDLKSSGIRIDAAAKHEVASVLWDSQESTTSVKMLRDTLRSDDIENQDIAVGRSGLLAQLGKQLADARLEKPGDILEKYLRPAIAHLPKDAVGREAGRVYHAFATFCDQQLQNPANVEDYNRISTLRQRKLEEVQDLRALIKSTKRTNEKKEHEYTLRKAEQWYKLDDEEFQHQKKNRETFVNQSLQNYLLALHASDEHNLSVLRFFALWLESSESAPANETVKKHLPTVPSWKFIVLLNQLMSRLKADNSTFQIALSALTKRMCLTHPYHSVHHVYASTRIPTSKDEATITRYNAVAAIRKEISRDTGKGQLFQKLFKADGLYRQLADEPIYDKKIGKRPLRDITTAVEVARAIPTLGLPPVTIGLPLRPDGNYDDVPHVTKFSNTVSIMSGLSSPKVLTAYSSDGQQYRQLFKSGNDDLRQDAIMEQVFEEVSKMLQNHKATRQRNLHIRTYKVIPTSPKSGIIEFVPNSVPINEFLNPAHAKYYPKDMSNTAARESVRTVQNNSTETRVKAFRKVCDNLHPVMRHFFLERFDDPDDWFEKRTAYTRTTASVSMLGHVLGLGDRHGHNIMLDEKTGEVVHIDLGVAFEAGRILPVPELVPFRLTRDIVDGMGVTKTEGTFRRCCEFTMDALREDKDSIMTLLNVLRYDPLYNWTLSPLRAKRMQDAQDGGHGAKDVEAAESTKAKMESEGGEADRALAIVEKKLSKTLSTAATVNELIQQATDEKNLATLFAATADLKAVNLITRLVFHKFSASLTLARSQYNAHDNGILRTGTTPCFRSVAHVITHDPGAYYRDHFGCVAYDYSRGPLSYKSKWFSKDSGLYQCCNNKIENFDLAASRHALLRVLMLSSPENFMRFASTLQCNQHRDTGGMAVSWTRVIWFDEMACPRRDWSGSCECCNTRKPQYRWDAGMSAKESQIALTMTAHMCPVAVRDEKLAVSPSPSPSECSSATEEQSETPSAQTNECSPSWTHQCESFARSGAEKLNLVRVNVGEIIVVILATLTSLMMATLVGF